MAKERKKILMVDDNPVIQRLYRRIFENAGYEVQEAYSGEECLRNVAGKVPDIILMDVILPDIDGKVVVRKINSQEKTRAIPVIFVTNTLSAEKDKGYETITIDGRDYRAFAKPIHVSRLLSVVRKEYNRHVHGGPPPAKLLPNGEARPKGGQPTPRLAKLKTRPEAGKS
mgnify:CR=1 FL=1